MSAEALCLNYGSKLEICSGKSNTNEHKVSFILYGHTPHRLKGEILITDATSTSTSHPTHSERLSTPREASYRGAQIRPILVRPRSCIATVAASPILYLECEGIARPAPRYASPKRYASPAPYRAYSSYPAERKVSFLRRKTALA